MSLRIGVLADLHGSLDPDERGSWFNTYDFAGMLERIDDALAWFEAEQADVVALAGDVSHRADASALDAVLERCTRGCGCPLVVVAGNHDVDDGPPPLPGAILRAGGERLALAHPEGTRAGAVRLAGVQVGHAESWLRARLEAPPAVEAWGEDPVVLLSHYPLLSHALRLAERGLGHPGEPRDDGSLRVTRRTRRTDAARAAFEPALAAADGAWRFAGGRWAAEAGARGSAQPALVAQPVKR